MTNTWKEGRAKFAHGDICKAQQLKEYHRVDGLCFKFGEKYAPDHQCAQPVVDQLNAMHLETHQEILSNELLEVVIGLGLSH
jgi:hypothetical protein